MRHAAAWQLAQQALLDGVPAVLITVAAIKGSAPREAGACMCISTHAVAGTIGGGTLEYKAIDAAREMLLSDTLWLHQQLGLGPALGQCCGGRVELLLERLEQQDLVWLEPCLAKAQSSTLRSNYRPGQRDKSLLTKGSNSTRFSATKSSAINSDHLQLEQPSHPGHFHLLLFGAGHLGQALVTLLATLPCSVHWIDTREHAFPAEKPKNVQCEWLETPTLALQDAPHNSLALVITHNHALDFEISTAALANQHVDWVGMIGSNNKRRQFERHLSKQPETLTSERLQCPIGQRHPELREPAELAIVLSAAILCARNTIKSLHTEAQIHA